MSKYLICPIHNTDFDHCNCRIKSTVPKVNKKHHIGTVYESNNSKRKRIYFTPRQSKKKHNTEGVHKLAPKVYVVKIIKNGKLHTMFKASKKADADKKFNELLNQKQL